MPPMPMPMPMHRDQLRHPAALPRKKLQRRPCTLSSHNNYRGTVTAKLTDEKLLERRTFSTMALLESLSGGDCCDDMAEKHQQAQLFVDQQARQLRRKPYKYYGGFRPDYNLGDMLRSPQHLITEPSYKRFLSSTQALNKQEFAFIKRSNGSFSYAILAHRSMEPPKNKGLTSTGENSEVMLEECMTFVMNETGSTKMIRQRFWAEHVRLVAECTQEELDKLEGKKEMEKFLQCFDSKKSSPSQPVVPSCQKAVPPQEQEHVYLGSEYPQEEQDKLEEKKNMEKFLQCFDSKQSSPSQSIASCQDIAVPKSQEELPQVVYQQVIRTDARKEGACDNVVPPNIISCTRLTYEEDDDCSSVSSASEYARYYEQYLC